MQISFQTPHSQISIKLISHYEIISLDIGDVRIGIAGAVDGIVMPLVTYTRTKSIKAEVRYIAERIESFGAELVVVGKPVNGDDEIQINKNNEFKERLERRFDIPFVLVDESWTSVEAEEALLELDTSRNKRKKLIDQIAAQKILESYLRNKNQ